ncbi:MAG: hypothetical protein ABMA64_11645 [Myxococcota bacterium]
MWLWVVASCTEPSTSKPDSTTPDSTGPTTDSAPLTSPETATTGATADTGPEPTGGPDLLLSGDPAHLTAIVELAWGVSFPQAWFVSGITFAEGSYHWSGATAVPYAGLETCEVRVDRPDYDADYLDAGDLTLSTSVDTLTLSPAFTGGYVASTDLATIDPRGKVWSVSAAGDVLPPFSLPDAITFPAGELGVDAPIDDAQVDRAAPLEVRWTGEPSAFVQLDLIPIDRHEWARCRVADDGAYDVDPSVLGLLTAGRLEITVARAEVAGPAIDAGPTWVQLMTRQTTERFVDLLP